MDLSFLLNIPLFLTVLLLAALASVDCPLPGCENRHQVRTAKNGKLFFSCDTWLNRVFANTDVARAWFENGASGGAIRTNPSPSSRPLTIQEERAAAAGFEDAPSAAPTRSADELSPIRRKLGPGPGD